MPKKLGMILALLLCMGMVFSVPVYAEGGSIWKKTVIDEIKALTN